MSMLNIGLPPSNINPKDPAAVLQIAKYVYRLTDEISRVLNNLDASNFSPSYNEQFTALTSVSDKAKDLASLFDDGKIADATNVRRMYQELSDTIYATADNITASFNSLIEQTQNAITAYVEANYFAEAEGIALQEQLTSAITQTADAIRLEFTTLATINAESINDLALTFSTYFRYSEDGLEIGKLGDGASPVITRITNERIEWIIAGTEVVLFYIDGATGIGHLSMAEVGTLTIGDDANGYMDMDMDADGLSFRWRVGEE